MSIGSKEELQVLLAEYAATRQEILSRYTALTQTLIYGVSSFLALATFMFTYSFWIGLLPLIVDLAVLWYGITIINFDTRSAADHLVILETRINGIAGNTLLTWETQNGLRAKPLGERLKQSFNVHVRIIGRASVGRGLAEKGALRVEGWLSAVRGLAERLLRR